MVNLRIHVLIPSDFEFDIEVVEERPLRVDDRFEAPLVSDYLMIKPIHVLLAYMRQKTTGNVPQRIYHEANVKHLLGFLIPKRAWWYAILTHDRVYL